jgi:hypothetical protein
MRLGTVALCGTSLCCTVAVALSQKPQANLNPLALAVPADGAAPQAEDQHAQVTASFVYIRSRQERVVRELITRIDLQQNIRREAELKTLHESPLSTVLNLSRFLTSRGYKRADGSPLIDLTF